jgi:hypothetical protein
VELRFAEALAVARIKARIEKTDWSAGNALRKLKMQFFVLFSALAKKDEDFYSLICNQFDGIICWKIDHAYTLL